MISFSAGSSTNLVASAGSQADSAPTPTDGNIRAPMPGIVVSIAVKEGDEISAGDTILVMEAMKMENNITATSSGTVKKIHVQAGEEVSNNQLLVEL